MLDRLWNGWRSQYVRGESSDHADERLSLSSDSGSSVFTRILQSGMSDEEAHIVFRGANVFAILNAFPYASGHVLVLPYREIADLEDLSQDESDELWSTVTDAVRAIKTSHRPHAMNVGINLGTSAGGSISQHLHVHVVPRWEGDANFMTSVAETRTLPESLPDTARRIRLAWPHRTQQ